MLLPSNPKLTCDISKALWLPVKPYNDRVVEPEAKQSFSDQRGVLREDQVPQLPQPTPSVGHQVAVENLRVVKNDSQGISAHVNFSRLALVVDKVSELAETLLLVEEEERLDFESFRRGSSSGFYVVPTWRKI